MSCGSKEAIVFGLGLISGTGTTLYVMCARNHLSGATAGGGVCV